MQYGREQCSYTPFQTLCESLRRQKSVRQGPSHIPLLPSSAKRAPGQGIIDTLNDLLKKFEARKEDLMKEEETAQKAFDEARLQRLPSLCRVSLWASRLLQVFNTSIHSGTV